MVHLHARIQFYLMLGWRHDKIPQLLNTVDDIIITSTCPWTVQKKESDLPDFCVMSWRVDCIQVVITLKFLKVCIMSLHDTFHIMTWYYLFLIIFISFIFFFKMDKVVLSSAKSSLCYWFSGEKTLSFWKIEYTIEIVQKFKQTNGLCFCPVTSDEDDWTQGC